MRSIPPRAIVLAALLLPAVAAGQGSGAVEGAPAPRPRETVYSLTMKGGWVMIPIALTSLVVLTVAIERAISLRAARVGGNATLDRVLGEIPNRAKATKDQVMASMARLDAENTVISRVLREGVEKIHRDEMHVQTFLQEAAMKEFHLLKRKLRPLSISASVAPLLGLLGTIFGMITCFENAAAADASSRAESLARGIYEALVTTAAGLCIAIPAVVVYHYLNGRVDNIADDVDETATRFLDYYFGVPLGGRGLRVAAASREEVPSGAPAHHAEPAAAAPKLE